MPPVPAVATAGLTRPASVASSVSAASSATAASGVSAACGVSAASGGAIQKVVLPVTAPKKVESSKKSEHERVSEGGDLIKNTPLSTNERTARKLEATQPDFKLSQTKVPRIQPGCDLEDWQPFVAVNPNLTTAEKPKKVLSPVTSNMASETRNKSSDSTKTQKPESDSLDDQIKFKPAHLAAQQQAENDRVKSFDDYWTNMANIVAKKSAQIDSAMTQRGAAVSQQASGAQRKPDNYIPSEVFNSSRFNQMETSKPKSRQPEFFSNGNSQTFIPFKSPERSATDERTNGRNPSRPRSETIKPVKSGSESKGKPVNLRGQYPERVKTFFIEDGAVHLYPFTSADFVRQQFLKPGLIEGTLFSVNIDRTFGLIKMVKESKRTR